MKTTDNTNVEWKRTAMRQARELARARAQRDAAVAALRELVRYSQVPMSASESESVWTQARAVIAASQGGAQ